jgi:penicillin-binding protein 2
MRGCRRSPSRPSASGAARWSPSSPTGGVLAFVSKPGFDPNLFVDGIDPQNWDELNNSPDRPLNNRALQGVYPPGSTFKPFMALAALELGKRTPAARDSPTPATFAASAATVPRLEARRPRHGRHAQVHRGVLRHLLLRLANDLGIDAIHASWPVRLRRRTGIDIDGEAAGVLPSQEWKMRRFKQKWFAGDTISSIGIGQGYNSYTPLQLAQATATLANNGVMFRPHSSSYDRGAARRAHRSSPQPLRASGRSSRSTSRFVRKAMVGVNRPGAPRARAFAGARVHHRRQDRHRAGDRHQAGREVRREAASAERHRDHALFIAFAPAESPEDRAGGAGGERRLRQRGRRADRARR